MFYHLIVKETRICKGLAMENSVKDAIKNYVVMSAGKSKFEILKIMKRKKEDK